MSKTTEALQQLIMRQLSREKSRAPNVSWTNSRGRRFTADEESAGSVIGSTTEIDASSCVLKVEVTYVPPDPPTG